MCVHPEAKSSTDIDMTQIDEATTAAEKPTDKAQKTTEAEHIMPEGDNITHTAQQRIAAWAEGKQGHQEMKAWNAAFVVPLD